MSIDFQEKFESVAEEILFETDGNARQDVVHREDPQAETRRQFQRVGDLRQISEVKQLDEPLTLVLIIPEQRFGDEQRRQKKRSVGEAKRRGIVEERDQRFERDERLVDDSHGQVRR